MAKVDVQIQETDDGYQCQVTVLDGNSKTEHQVTVQHEDYDRLTQGEVSPEELVKASFHFLLERESKESILRSFDLMDIAHYYPRYEDVIRRRLG